MRLIDADALLLRIDCHGTNKFGMLDEDIREYISKQPTIDPEIVQPQWIPVAERSPEHYRNEDGTLIPFVVCVRNCKNPVVSYYNGQIWGDMGRMDVVAWAPTPEPYTPAGEEAEHGTTE